jgi:hypothetical protein
LSRRLKAKLFVAMGLIVASLVANGMLSNSFNWKDRGAASARDSRMTAELTQILTKAGANDLIKVWVELDRGEYDNETGSSFSLVLKQYMSGREKLSRAAYSELLPDEVVAITYYDGEGVEPPVELKKLHPYLDWFLKELTPTMINSIARFPGMQKISLYKAAEDSKNESFMVSYVGKVAEEYPMYRIKLDIDIIGKIDPETAVINYDYESASLVLQKYGAEIVDVWTDLHGIYAWAPPNLQLIAELSSLPEVQYIGTSTLVVPHW